MESIAYVDETGIDNFFYRNYAYATRGTKVYQKISGRKFQRTNIVAAKLGNDIIAPLQYSGTTDSILFEFWFEKHLLPSLPDNSVIVMDNASFHRKERLRTLASSFNKKIIFLPPYSPDLNPIEKFWAALKTFLRFNLSSFPSLDLAISSFFLVN